MVKTKNKEKVCKKKGHHRYKRILGKNDLGFAVKKRRCIICGFETDIKSHEK